MYVMGHTWIFIPPHEQKSQHSIGSMPKEILETMHRLLSGNAKIHHLLTSVIEIQFTELGWKSPWNCHHSTQVQHPFIWVTRLMELNSAHWFVPCTTPLRWYQECFVLPNLLPSLKLTASFHLKMDGWNTTYYFPIGALGLFSGAMYRAFAVSFREGMPSFSKRIRAFLPGRSAVSLGLPSWKI